MLNKMSRPVVAFFFESSRFSEFFEFRKKNTANIWGVLRGTKIRLLVGFSQKNPEVLLADAVFGHSHFCDTSEAWIGLKIIFRRQKTG